MHASSVSVVDFFSSEFHFTNEIESIEARNESTINVDHFKALTSKRGFSTYSIEARFYVRVPLMCEKSPHRKSNPDEKKLLNKAQQRQMRKLVFCFNKDNPFM